MDKITEIIGFINPIWKDEHIPYKGSIFHLFVLRANESSKSILQQSTPSSSMNSRTVWRFLILAIKNLSYSCDHTWTLSRRVIFKWDCSLKKTIPPTNRKWTLSKRNSSEILQNIHLCPKQEIVLSSSLQFCCKTSVIIPDNIGIIKESNGNIHTSSNNYQLNLGFGKLFFTLY